MMKIAKIVSSSLADFSKCNVSNLFSSVHSQFPFLLLCLPHLWPLPHTLKLPGGPWRAIAYQASLTLSEPGPEHEWMTWKSHCFSWRMCGSGAARPAHYVSQGSFTKRKGEKEELLMGRGGRGMTPPSQTNSHPHGLDSTNVTSCLCHRADFIVVFIPCPPPFLSSSFFCFVFRNNKGTPQSRLETSFFSVLI